MKKRHKEKKKSRHWLLDGNKRGTGPRDPDINIIDAIQLKMFNIAPITADHDDGKDEI